MAGYWPLPFCVFIDLYFVSVHKKDLGQYPAILTSRLPITYIYMQSKAFESDQEHACSSCISQKRNILICTGERGNL